MMRILYDHQTFSLQRYGGISRYFANLIKGVSSRSGYEASVAMLYHTNYYLDNKKYPLDNALGRLVFEPKPGRISKWNKQYSKHLIKKNNYELLHPTYFDPYFIKGLRKPYVLTVHDMIYEQLPHLFLPTERLPEYKRTTTKNAAGLIAISQSTKNDMMQFFKIPAERIQMIYHGINTTHPVAYKSIDNLPATFILFTGERANYKNFTRLIHAFAELRTHHRELHLVCAGGGVFTNDELLHQKKHGVINYCKQLHVDDAELNFLYQQAQLFVFPSLYEGFGYPLLEAFRVGCAVSASNTSSFPEVGGDAVHYFNPEDTHSIFNTVNELLNNTLLRKQYIANGYEQLKHFTIEREIEETLNFYSRVTGR